MDTIHSALRHDIYTFLAGHNVLSLSYIDKDEPASCALWYAVTQDLSLFFASSMRTHHGAALQRGGRIAFTVQKDDQHWRAIRGVQGKGYCAPVLPEQWAGAWDTYSKRFPFVLQPFASVAQAISSTTLWSVKPDWIRLIDNSKGFGHKEEIRFDTTV